MAASTQLPQVPAEDAQEPSVLWKHQCRSRYLLLLTHVATSLHAHPLSVSIWASGAVEAGGAGFLSQYCLGVGVGGDEGCEIEGDEGFEGGGIRCRCQGSERGGTRA